MALFPKCSFQVLLPGGMVVPGTRVEGILVVEAPEPIPRAEHVELVFRSVAWAGYGGGKSRTVDRRVMFEAPFRVDIRQELLAAGTHRFPFGMEVPAWLPPGYIGNDCAIEHLIEARVDVDWAIDPSMKIVPIVSMLAREGTRAPLTTRSPAGFHESIVLEVTLPSSVIAHDEPLLGQIALRSGHDARFDAVQLSFGTSTRITMSRGDRRHGAASILRIPKEALRSGEAVPFQFAPNQRFSPSFRSSFIDHEVVLGVSVDIPWATDPAFEVTLDVLPAGSTIQGGASANLVGAERLRRIAALMAESTGLREGRPPSLVEGASGPVALRVADAPRGAVLGVSVDLVFPDVELGIDCHPLGMLEGFRSSPLLPPPLADRYLLRCHPPDARPPVDDVPLSAFIRELVADLGSASELRLSDHHLGINLALANDDPKRMIEIARFAKAKMATVAEAIGHLPFPVSVMAARPAWLATAAEQSAFLVPTGPSLHGLSFRARVLGGEERSIGATLRTRWKAEGPITYVDVDLRGAELPKSAWAELESATPSERFRAVRAVFPSAHVLPRGQGATLERPGFTGDPRSLLSAIETFFEWVLDTRGERRVDAPYR